MTKREEQLAWLQALVSTYHAEHDWNEDEDPTATVTMLESVCGLLTELRAELMCVAFEDDHRLVQEFDAGGEG